MRAAAIVPARAADVSHAPLVPEGVDVAVDVASAVAALPAVVHVCEALGVGGAELRASAEWQLTGQGTTTVAGALPPPTRLLGASVGSAGRANSEAHRPAKAAKAAGGEVGGTVGHLRQRAPASWQRDSPRERRPLAASLGLLPHWTAVLSCALALLVGRLLVGGLSMV